MAISVSFSLLVSQLNGELKGHGEKGAEVEPKGDKGDADGSVDKVKWDFNEGLARPLVNADCNWSHLLLFLFPVPSDLVYPNCSLIFDEVILVLILVRELFHCVPRGCRLNFESLLLISVHHNLFAKLAVLLVLIEKEAIHLRNH